MRARRLAESSAGTLTLRLKLFPISLDQYMVQDSVIPDLRGQAVKLPVPAINFISIDTITELKLPLNDSLISEANFGAV